MPVKTGSVSKAKLMTAILTVTLQILMRIDKRVVHSTTVGEPLDLLALHPTSMACPNDHRDGRRHHGAHEREARSAFHYPHDRAINAVGVHDLWEVAERPGVQRVA